MNMPANTPTNSPKPKILVARAIFPEALAKLEESYEVYSNQSDKIMSPEELKKALSEGLPLTEDVAFFVAKHLRSNVRELEGALRKILAYVRFHGKEITIEVAREALKDLLSVQNRQISVENIQKTVADFYNIKIADMYSKKRPANIARPRQIAMYIAKELTQKSLPEIGELFGGRDHTTVLHAVRKITEERSRDNQLNHELHVLEQSLKN
jgi:chromosomal replication initiator protein